MHSFSRFLIALLVILPPAFTQDVGSGAPNTAISYAFFVGYYRNGFANLVTLPPVNNVQALGTSGYIQEFNSAAGSGKYALILPNTTGSAQPDQFAVFQSYPAVYAYYAQIGVNTAGYPTTDTQPCPALNSNSCTYQTFSKPYILFAYSTPVNGGSASNFFTRDPFYTKWQALGGIFTLGPTTSAETAFTSAAGNVSTVQAYTTGMIANITSGNVSARIVGVQEPVWDLYAGRGGYAGSMGLPLTDPLVQSNGHLRQNFEGGSVDYDPKVPGSAAFLLPVKSVGLSPSPVGGTLRLNDGDTATLTATAYGTDGSALNGRLFTWNTTNGRILSVQANGNVATIKAVGGGAASVTVSSEGVTSTAVNVFVTAPCCAVGEGAPTPALQQSFQTAITRNKLNPKLPAASPVTQIGSGYLQQFQAADTGNLFWIAAAQSTGNAYLIQDPMLTVYQNLGGPSGALGYPLSDPTPGGRQTFQGAALAGAPVQLVTGAILSKWILLGYETGSAGSPTGAASTFLTFRATTGTWQTFKNATIFAISSGPQSGKSYSITGPILASYTDPTSDLGVPINDEIGLNGVRHQDFEGGYMEYSPGDSTAQIFPAPRVPTVSATPASAPAGSVVRLAVGGFAAGAQVRVSITGQQSFIATVPSGAYVWENYIPATAGSSTVTIAAVDVNNNQASSQASYSIRGGSAAGIGLKAVLGDTQSGLPGAILPVSIQVQLADAAGNPIPNAPITFIPSPGGEVSDAAKATDASGMATANWRLPNQEGIALLSVNAGGHLLNISGRAVPSSLANFPVISQTGMSAPLGNGPDSISSKGALLVSAAAAVRYFQNLGQMPAPLGLADPAGLNSYLKSVCVTDSTGAQTCDGFLQPSGSSDQIVNLWRLQGFVNNSVDIRTIAPDDKLVRDAIARGNPVILSLSLLSNGTISASHFVVATGVDAGGNLVIMDPAYGQTSLSSYLNGFQASPGAMISASFTGAAVVSPQAPVNPGFLVAVSAPTSIQSPGGPCGDPFLFPVSSGTYALHYCGGSASQFYELDMQPADPSASFQGSFIDLAGSSARADFSGGGAAGFSIDHSSGQWTIAPLALQFQASNVVNSASQTTDLAPGGLASITGVGLASPGAQPVIAVNGEYAPILKATPFRLDFQIPADAAGGVAVLDVVSDLTGSAEQTITLKPVAPAVQLAGGPRQGVIVNQDGSPNGRYKPATRGQTINVFGTGFGSLSPPRSLATPVQAFVGGAEVTVTSVIPVPNSPGMYQLTLSIPATLTPGLSLELLLQQGDATSNPVDVAIQ